MKIALVSDIHANLQAWRAVLLDIRSLKADLIVCLGDLVGYGPNPAEVVASVCANANYCVLGNHDAALCGKIGVSDFSEVAARSLAWTRTRVGPKVMHYLSLLPLTIATGGSLSALSAGAAGAAAETTGCRRGFRCAHGEFSVPGQFNYVFDPQDASPSWKTVTEPILFVGHTHQPGIFVLGNSGLPHHIAPQDFMLEAGKRFLVNVGSVGQPRDGDTRAGYCIFDFDESSVFWRRIPFDLDAFRAALQRNGIPESDNPFLKHDPLAGQRNPRELVGFRPSDNPEDAARDAVAVQNIDLLHRSVRRWRRTAWFLIGFCVLAGLALAWFWFFKMSHPAEIRGGGSSLNAPALGEGAVLLRMPQTPAEPGASIEGWTIRLADSRRQSVALARDPDGVALFKMDSELADAEVAVASAPVSCAPGMKLVVEGLFRKSPDFSGYVVATIKFARRADSGSAPPGAEGDSAGVIVKEPKLLRQGGWRALKHTFPVPARADQVVIQIGGKFKGSVEVKELTLVRKE